MTAFMNLFRRSRRVERRVEQEFMLHDPSPPVEPEFYLSMAAIARNEGRYLREWIEFHRLMGVERFTIYDNGSTDDTARILAPYVGEGVVEVVPWPHFLRDYDTQALAYAHALRHAGPRTRWLAFLDIDEYLFSPAAATVTDLLREYEDLPALVVYWVVFGTAGHADSVDAPLIEAFTKRAPLPCGAARDPVLANYKSIVQPRRIVGNRGAHNFITEDGCNGYDEHRRQIRRKEPRRVTVERLRINHYYTKSLSEWTARFGRMEGPGTIARDSFLRDAFERVEAGALHDREILRFAPMLRHALASPRASAPPPQRALPAALPASGCGKGAPVRAT